jgi:ABC-type methionine transport system ATPase subunit
MAKRAVMFTFPKEVVAQPVIYNLGQQYRVVTNVRRADVSERRGWVVLELQGKDDDIENALAWVASVGVRVDAIGGEISAG